VTASETPCQLANEFLGILLNWPLLIRVRGDGAGAEVRGGWEANQVLTTTKLSGQARLVIVGGPGGSYGGSARAMHVLLSRVLS